MERNRVEFSTTFDPGVLDLRGAELEQPSPLVFVGSAELMEGEMSEESKVQFLHCFQYQSDFDIVSRKNWSEYFASGTHTELLESKFQ